MTLMVLCGDLNQKLRQIYRILPFLLNKFCASALYGYAHMGVRELFHGSRGIPENCTVYTRSL